MKTLFKRIFILAVASMLILAAGCGRSESGKPKPVPINEGVDKCEVCNMLISDDQHATQIILKDGRALKFDDIGDLFAWTEKNGTDDVSVRYVRDYHTKEWIELEAAHFVYDPSFKTPMGYGVYSFKEKADAETFIEEQQTGTLMTAADLENHSWESGHGHGDGHDHGDGHEHEGHDHEHEDGHDHEDGEHGDGSGHEGEDHASDEHGDDHE